MWRVSDITHYMKHHMDKDLKIKLIYELGGCSAIIRGTD